MSEPAPAAESVARMPLREHLVELRGRLLRATAAIFVAFFVAWAFHAELFDLISAPVRSAMADNGLFAMRAIHITEAIGVYIKIALLGAFVLASPYVFWQVWAFIAPGLLAGEKHFAVPVIGASVMFFLAGTAFCYLVVLPFMTNFLITLTMQGQDVSLLPTLQSVVNYSLWLLGAFGLIFELPVFMYFLSAMGLVTARGLVQFYRYWVVIAFIIGAVLTPTPDPVNQTLMSGPLVVLYGIGVGIAWIVERDRSSGSRMSWKGAGVLALLLTASVLVGGARVAKLGGRDPIDDLPADAEQIVGVRLATVARLDQEAGRSSRAALGLLRLAIKLSPGAERNLTLWLVRLHDGAAALMRRPGSGALIRDLSRRHLASIVDYAGGRSVVLRVPGQPRRLRFAAPDDDTLWVGDDRALAAMIEVRAGLRRGVGTDPRLAELVQKLRSSGPLFGLSASTGGIRGWLPSGALADTVKLATAVVPKKADRIVLHFRCKGPDAAKALRNRLDAWAADARTDAGPSDGHGAGPLREQMARLAKLVERLADLAGRSPALRGDPTMAGGFRAVVSEAAELRSRLLDRGGPVPATRVSTSTLRRAVAPPAVLTTRHEGPGVWWTIEAPSRAVLGAFFAPSPAGLRGDPTFGPAASPSAAPGAANPFGSPTPAPPVPGRRSAPAPR